MKAILASFPATLILAAAVICSSSIPANAQTFQPTVNISNSPGGAQDYQLAANGSNVFAVWADVTPGNADIFFRRSTDGGVTWGQITNLSASPISSRIPQIAVSGNQIFIVWDEFTDFNASHRIMLRRSTDGGATFFPPQQLSDDTSQVKNCFGNIAASGNVVIPYWTDCSNPGVGTVFRRSTDAGITFGSPQIPSVANTKIVVSGNNVYIAGSGWGPKINLNALLFIRSTNAGATFENDKIIFSPSVFVNDLVAGGDNVYLSWQPQPQWDDFNVYFTRSLDRGATFPSPVNISNNPQGLSGHSSRLAVVDQQVYVAWSGTDFGSFPPPIEVVTDTYFRKSADGGVTFSPKINLSNNKTSIQPDIGATSDGVYVSWLNTDNVTPRINDVILRASNDRGTTFSSAVNMSANGNVDSPGLVVSDSSIFITWRGPSASTGFADVFIRRSTPAPVLFTYENSARAIALDSVTMVRDPFSITTTLNFSADQRTRLMLFATNAALLPGESASVITAQAEDSQHRVFTLPVEFVGQVPGFDWLTQINVKLPDELTNAGDVQVSINVRGLVSNKAITSIKPTAP